MHSVLFIAPILRCLNESPYEKVGKFQNLLKVLVVLLRLNESPYEKVGK